MSTPLLEVRNICKNFGDRQMLNNISLEIQSGDMISIVGKSGAGKSTLLNILALFEMFDSGEYLVNGGKLPTGERKLAKIRNTNYGFVFQSYNLLTGLTARENIYLPLEYASRQSRKNAYDINRLAEELGITNLLGHNVNDLSGGEKQRVAIARAIINKPNILFADEPTGNLDGSSRDDVLQLLKQVCYEHKIAIVVVTHDNAVARHMLKHYTLKEGCLHEE